MHRALHIYEFAKILKDFSIYIQRFLVMPSTGFGFSVSWAYKMIFNIFSLYFEKVFVEFLQFLFM